MDDKNNIRAVENYLVANLIEAFRILNPEKYWHRAPKIAKDQLSRFSSDKKDLLNHFENLAIPLRERIDHLSLRDFAHQSIMLTKRFGFFDTKKLAPDDKNHLTNAKANIQRALFEGYCEKTAILRAANELLQKDREQKREIFRQNELKSHPLREVLFLSENIKIAKEDVRYHLLNLKRTSGKNQSVLFEILIKTRIFSPHHIHHLLGDELFFLARPKGFLDRSEETIVIEVVSPAHQTIVSFRKMEIINRLKADKAFVKIKNIWFNIKAIE